MTTATRTRRQRPAERRRRHGTGWAVAAILALSGAAMGQGFMVQPMVIEDTARPGQVKELGLDVRNTKADAPLVVTIASVLLAQSSDLSWQLVEPKGPDAEHYAGRSCRDWLTLGPDTLTVPGIETRHLSLRLRVPGNARGTYCAALTLRQPPPAGPGIHLTIQFLVPILLHIQGPAAKARVRADGLAMGFAKGKTGGGTTFAGLQVANTGEVDLRLGGTMTVLYRSGTRWRRILDLTLPNKIVLPGMVGFLSNDLQRRLPSGHYKLQGVLKNLDKPAVRLEQELDFQGDPDMTRLAVDVPMEISPEALTLPLSPGMRRVTMVTVKNPSDEPLRVAAKVDVPPALRAVAIGDLDGLDLSCAGWTQVAPETFELRPGQQRNVRLVMAYPRTAKLLPGYYAHLQLAASYLDGQSAGSTRVVLTIQNQKVTATPRAQGQRLLIEQQEGNRYGLTASFENTGVLAFEPTANAVMVNGLDQAVVPEFPLDPASKVVLPMGTVFFSGAMDLSALAAGDYFLLTRMKYATDKTVEQKLPLRVEVKDGQRLVSVVNPAEGATP